MHQLTRALILLGLVPTALATWGFLALLLTAAGGYLAFLAMYSIPLRDYETMKTIFILPAFPAFAAALELGGGRLLGGGRKRQRGGLRRTAVAVVLLALALLLAG